MDMTLKHGIIRNMAATPLLPLCSDHDAWQHVEEAVLGQGLEHSVLLDHEEVSCRAPGG